MARRAALLALGLASLVLLPQASAATVLAGRGSVSFTNCPGALTRLTIAGVNEGNGNWTFRYHILTGDCGLFVHLVPQSLRGVWSPAGGCVRQVGSGHELCLTDPIPVQPYVDYALYLQFPTSQNVFRGEGSAQLLLA
jgi:hypothetical protein